MRKTISKEFIDCVFETCRCQTDIVEALYRFAFPDWDIIERINGFPAIGKAANNYIFEKFFEFDRKHHPNVIPGGAWLNNGFSTLDGRDLCLGPWEVSTERCQVTYFEPDVAIIAQHTGRSSCLTCGD